MNGSQNVSYKSFRDNNNNNSIISGLASFDNGNDASFGKSFKSSMLERNDDHLYFNHPNTQSSSSIQDYIWIHGVKYSFPDSDINFLNLRKIIDSLLLRIDRKIKCVLYNFNANSDESALVLTSQLDILADYIKESTSRIMIFQV